MKYSYVATEAGEVPLPPLHPYGVEMWGTDSKRSKEGREIGMWTCIGLDPGGTTGWCVLRIHAVAMRSNEYRILENVASWTAGQINGSIGHQIDKLVELVDAWPEAEIVCEDFVLRQMRGGRELLDPVRITEPLKWWLERGGIRAWDHYEDGEGAWKPRGMELQQPSLAMTTITDERLKAFGVFNLTKGQPHARDAVRHALTFARRRKVVMAAAVTSPVTHSLMSMTREERER